MTLDERETHEHAGARAFKGVTVLRFIRGLYLFRLAGRGELSLERQAMCLDAGSFARP